MLYQAVMSELKKNIRDLQDDSALQMILNIQPKKYNYIDLQTKGSLAGTEIYGFIAQQIKEVIPDAVKIQTELPAHFTNANTSVYLVFNEMRTVVGMYGEPTVKKFISGKVPVGKPITIVVISKQGNDYYLGKQISNSGLNVTGNSNQSVPITPIKTGLADIKAYLGTL